MTRSDPLYAADAYLREADATVVAHTPEGGIVLDRSLFYATGGGQPGDSGALVWPGGVLAIETAIRHPEHGIVLVPAAGAPLAAPGTRVRQQIDWDRRYGHMRVHTALHLLSCVIPLPVTGGAVSAAKGCVDFNMAEAPKDKLAIEQALQELIRRDLEVTDTWISEAELDANPGLVKTLSVAPPRGAGRIRLVRIGAGAGKVDLQPCGGTHVARTSEIGEIRLGKIEKKGRQNRRVYLHLVDATKPPIEPLQTSA
jgi:misacylated tRNA(Ala) deacylase